MQALSDGELWATIKESRVSVSGQWLNCDKLLQVICVIGSHCDPRELLLDNLTFAYVVSLSYSSLLRL